MSTTYTGGAVALVLLSMVTAGVAEARQAVLLDTLPGSGLVIELVRVPGGTVRTAGASGSEMVEVPSFWIGRTEVTWELYDRFAFGLDSVGAPGGADAIARPSRPYGAPDYGFGHHGFPVISVTREAAEAFSRWLSARTGHRYRLPTEAEWQRAADLAVAGRDPAQAGVELGWHAGNAGAQSRAVASRPADALGLHDLFGNAAEWVASADGRRVTRGGSWRDPAAQVGPAARAVQDDSWNERDPQFPKSQWWLSDAPFVGFRLVREP